MQVLLDKMGPWSNEPPSITFFRWSHTSISSLGSKTTGPKMDFILNAIDKQLETFCHFLPNSHANERSTHGQVQWYSHYNTMHKSCTCQLVSIMGKKIKPLNYKQKVRLVMVCSSAKENKREMKYVQIFGMAQGYKKVRPELNISDLVCNTL